MNRLTWLATLGDTIRHARTTAKRSQRSLAKAARTSQPYIDKLEHNQVDPRYSTLVRLFDELGYELVPVPKASVSIVREMMARDDDEPLIPFLDDQDHE